MKSFAPNSPFLVDDSSNNIAGVVSSTGVQRFYPLGFHSTSPLVLTFPAATGAVTWEASAGLLRIVTTNVHGLTSSPAVGRSVYLNWTGGTAAPAVITAIDTTSKITVNVRYNSGTATMGSAGSVVTFGADNKVVGQVTASPTYGAPMTVIKAAHGLVPGDAMQFTAGTSFPSPITNTPTPTTYYVSRVIQHLTAGTASDRFTISTSAGGPEVYQTTATGDNGSGTFTMYPVSTSLTWTAHGLLVGDAIRFTTTTTLPASLALATTYYVVKVVDANTLQISATAGGTPIVFTLAGSGTHTATSFYGTALAVVCEGTSGSGGTATLASITIPAGTLTRTGRLEVNMLVSNPSLGVGTFTVTYAGGTIYQQTFSGTGCLMLNKIIVANGATQVVTTTGAMSGHGVSGNTTTTITGVNYATADTTLIATLVQNGTSLANTWTSLDYYDVSVE
ncbi:hypothetical protein UFOVP496_24 [uncultured Caudovirales phage]|uniref:Uncharacterized protein n=1 Tax=uncultured Caudovirales phage TaxID=2100421 RepID=A0A6J5MI79_9CAUD|nr:hypothetical protein UFOVP496_24 [uncultured Caudovirales phage]